MDTSPTSGCPQASLIIPTHNRSQELARTLEALSHQTLGREHYEVIVVADGCSDGTGQVCAQFAGRMPLQLVEQAHAGPAVARNRGAALARGEILIFLDDDVEALPGLLAAHINTHSDLDAGQAVIGYLPPVLEMQTGYLRTELFGWWERTFQELRHPDRRARYSDLTSGNFSIPRRLFASLGGFNPDLRCHEDYELGLRLIEHGASLHYCEAAAGYHHERSSLQRTLARKYEEGVADVQLGRLSPELKPSLLMFRLEKYSLLPSRVLKRLAFRRSAFDPGKGDWLARLMVWSLGLAEKLRLFRLWQKLLYGQMGYWYWQGVRSMLGTAEAAAAFLVDVPAQAEAPLEVELAEGIERAEALLDQVRPASARLLYNKATVAQVPAEPGSERLRGSHLRALLVERYPLSLLRAMAASADFPYPELHEQLVARSQAYLAANPEGGPDDQAA